MELEDMSDSDSSNNSSSESEEDDSDKHQHLQTDLQLVRQISIGMDKIKNRISFKYFAQQTQQSSSANGHFNDNNTSDTQQHSPLEGGDEHLPHHNQKDPTDKVIDSIKKMAIATQTSSTEEKIAVATQTDEICRQSIQNETDQLAINDSSALLDFKNLIQSKKFGGMNHSISSKKFKGDDFQQVNLKSNNPSETSNDIGDSISKMNVHRGRKVSVDSLDMASAGKNQMINQTSDKNNFVEEVNASQKENLDVNALSSKFLNSISESYLQKEKGSLSNSGSNGSISVLNHLNDTIVKKHSRFNSPNKATSHPESLCSSEENSHHRVNEADIKLFNAESNQPKEIKSRLVDDALSILLNY